MLMFLFYEVTNFSGVTGLLPNTTDFSKNSSLKYAVVVLLSNQFYNSESSVQFTFIH